MPLPATSDERQATGRERHDQKITVYLSASELLDLEHARLRLRRFGYVLDRGRLVREAIAILLADLDARGKDSVVARRILSNEETAGETAQEAAEEATRDAGENGSQDKDEDAVPSLRTPFFSDVSGFRHCTTRAKKKEVLWPQPQAAP